MASKKLLIVTDINHASPRIRGLLKYLNPFGWDATVITPPALTPTQRYLPRLNCFRTLRPFRNFAVRRYHELFDYPDGHKRSLKQFIDAGRRALKRSKFNLILSSSSPVTCHLAAKQLKQQFNLPWIAEFRDLWSANANYPYTKMRHAVDWKLERETMETADALVTVSEPMAETLRQQHHKQVYVVPTGFDPDTRNVGSWLTDKFTITYTGQIYPQQDPTRVMVALEYLFAKNVLNREDVELRFYGLKNHRITDAAKALDLSDVVHQHGLVSREEALARQRESQVLLVLKWEDPKQKGIYCGKVFEYLAAERPILASGGSADVMTDLLASTQAGVDAQSTFAVKVALERFYREYKNYGKTRWWGNRQRVDEHSFVEMARKYAYVLNNN